MTDTTPVSSARAQPLVVPRLARAITEMTSPTVLAPSLLVAVSIRLAITRSATALIWGAIAAVFVGVLPLAFLLYGARRGRWDDHHVRRREARVVPLAFAMACVAIGLLLLWLGSAPQPLRALVTAMLAGLAVVLGISRVWKVSIHAAVAGGTALVAAGEFEWAGLGLGLTILVAAGWARVTSEDHNTAQVVVGALAGAAVAGAVYLPLR